MKLHLLDNTPVQMPDSPIMDNESLDVADRSGTLTNDSSTLTSSSNALEIITAANDADFHADSAGPAFAVVPVIVVEVEDEAISHSSLSPESPSEFSSAYHPCRPSVIAESQRLNVEKSGFSDSDSDSSSSGSSVSSPKAIKAAANAEKREKMPKTMAKNGRNGAAVSSAAAAAVRQRLAMLKLDEREEGEEEEAYKGEREKVNISVTNLPENGTVNAGKTSFSLSREGKALPTAPPRHRTRSRKSSSIKKQLSLIVEEGKTRRKEWYLIMLVIDSPVFGS